jgi:hypothetical protein
MLLDQRHIAIHPALQKFLAAFADGPIGDE